MTNYEHIQKIVNGIDKDELIRTNHPRDAEAALKIQHFSLPMPPSLNHLYATFRGRRILSAKGRAYKQLAAIAAIDDGAERMSGPIRITVYIFRPRKIGDLLNYEKILCDSLTDIAWIDDKQIVEAHFYRRDDKANPRAEVTVETVKK